MRTSAVIQSKYFSSAVRQMLASLFSGEVDAELAAILVRDDDDEQRRVLVATKLGILDVSLNLAQREHRTELEPLRASLIPWVDWRLTLMAGPMR